MAVGPRVLSDRSGDLDIAVIGQLLTADFALGDEFEPGPVKMVGFEAPFRRGGPAEAEFGSLRIRTLPSWSPTPIPSSDSF